MKPSRIWLLISLWLLSILVLLPVSPAIQRTPPRDSGIFLYVGSRLLKGDILYRDVWDHKPPLVFLINALGLWISGGSRWGVWALEAITLLIAVWIAFSLLRRSFGNIAGTLGVASGLALLFLTLHGGNYTEQYAIVFQFACIFFLVQAARKGRSWYAFACGAAIGILFFIRQNLIGVGVAIGLYLVLRALFNRSWLPLRQLAFITLGFMGVSAVFLLYIVSQGIFSDFWDAAFVYNQIYSDLGLLERLKSLGDTLKFFSQIPILLLSLPVWLLALALLLLHESNEITKILESRRTGWILLATGVISLAAGISADLLPESRSGYGLAQKAAIGAGLALISAAIFQLTRILPRLAQPWLKKIHYRLPSASGTIVAVAALWYPIEIGMISLSGRDYLHYYMAICAVCTVLYAFLADKFQRLFRFWKAGIANTLLVLIWSTGIALTLAYNPFNSIANTYTPGGDSEILKTVRYVEANTQPEDKVLIWGAEPLVNFLSGRSSPIRYVHVYPFYVERYWGEALSAQLLTDLQTNKPQLIIYTGDTPFVDITSDHRCEMPSQPLLSGMEDVMEFICDEYEYAGKIDSTGWKIYRSSIPE